jgi:carbon-monoxide dehydrogenase medium subunit
VDLAAVPALDAIRADDAGWLVLGASTPLRRIERDPLVRERQPALAATVARVATVRIRNQATIGGNLAHADPAQDPPPILPALDAEVEAVGPEGSRTIPLDAFFTDVFETVLRPADVLTAVRVPPLPPRSRVGYEKFLPRTVDDYAAVSVAARITLADDGRIADARVALGAAGPVPARVPEAEQLLLGSDPASVDVGAVATATRNASDPVDDVRGSADYKREMVAVWTVRLLGRLLERSGPDGGWSDHGAGS